MKYINQYSAAWLAGFLLILAGILLFRRKPRWPQFLAFGLLAAALFATWIVLHPRQTAQAEDAAQIQARIGQGTPVLLEFQSPY